MDTNAKTSFLLGETDANFSSTTKVTNGNFAPGINVVLKATEKVGFAFSGWYKNGEKLSVASEFHYEIPNEPTQIEAKFSTVQIDADYINRHMQNIEGVGSMLGKEVNYAGTYPTATSSNASGGWEILYSDGQNIYLIAKGIMAKDRLYTNDEKQSNDNNISTTGLKYGRSNRLRKHNR